MGRLFCEAPSLRGIAKMQTMGCDINPTSYSKLEGQLRMATDKEVYVIAKILKVSTDDLFEAK